MTMWKPDICIYHGGCDDGFGAAWVCWKTWGDDPEYIGMRYGDKLPDIAGKHVLMVDFSLKQAVMQGASQFAKSIVVLDHHKTAEAELKAWTVEGRGFPKPFTLAHMAENMEGLSGEDAVVAVFDMNKSGARLAWEFCYPGEDLPSLLLAVEDRDLWRFALRDTKEISAALRTYPHDFSRWDQFAADTGTLRNDGAAILRGHQKNVADFCANTCVTKIDGHKVPAVNVPYHYASDCAHELMQRNPDAPFAAAWFKRGDGTIQWSLRSDDNRVDVSEIAKKFGGGGHRNAAGFQAPAP